MRAFFQLVPLILLCGYLFLGFRLSASAVGWALLALPFLSMLWLPLVYWRSNRAASSRRKKLALYVSYSGIGYVSFLLTAVVARDAIALLLLVLPLTRPWAHALYAPHSGVVVALAAVGLFLLGYLETLRTPAVRRIDIPIAGLPPAWQGVTIAQVSDLHVGYSIRRSFVDRVIRAVEAEKPDLAVITGDFADGRPEALRDDTEPFRRLAPPLGTFYVTGNHEFYWGVDAWLEEVVRLGMTPLVNQHVVLDRGGERLVIAGVNDYVARNFPGTVRGDVAAAFAGAPAGATRILLAHQPRYITDAAPLGVDLQLSGHTHGGQFLPWIFVVGFFNPVARGLRRFGKTWVYVNPGTGYWGPPLRLGARAEITVLRLTA